MAISREHVVSQTAALLYAWGVVNDNEEVSDIDFGEMFKYQGSENIPIKIHLKKPREAVLIKHNEQSS